MCVTSPYADPSLGVQFSVLDVSNSASKAAARDLQVFSQPTRSVVVYPDGTAARVASPNAADFIRNQTATAQAGGFNVSGAGTVGDNLTVGGTTSLGAGAAPAREYTATTGTQRPVGWRLLISTATTSLYGNTPGFVLWTTTGTAGPSASPPSTLAT